MYLNDWMGRRCRYTPDRVAIVDDVSGLHYSYAQMDSRSTRMAAFLQQKFTLQPGDRVACLSKNRIEYLDLFFACGKIGVVLVPLNFRLPTAGILDLLADCQPNLLVYELAFNEVADAIDQSGFVQNLLSLDSDDRNVCDHEAAVESYDADENDTAMLLYTSGTTGRAKGAMITWRQIHWNALNTIIGLQLTEEDAAFLNMPLYHTGAWHVLLTPLMLLGGRIVLQPRFDARRCNLRIGPEGVTILFGVPTMLRMMSEEPNFAEADFDQVRFAICGGEPCPLPVIETYRDRGVAIRQGYGLTEAGPNCFSLPAEDAVRKQGSIGFPNFFIGTRLIKSDGQQAGPGEVGELWMKGPHLCAGYWANPEETAKTIRDGWLCTGDLMQQDEDGYFFVIGRQKEMFISGGENVYPAQVERVLQSHEAVALAAVIGLPHPKWGETGWAYCQIHEASAVSEDELLGWCKQHLATYQCPTKIVILDNLPVGHSGKIDKLMLRQNAEKLEGNG